MPTVLKETLDILSFIDCDLEGGSDKTEAMTKIKMTTRQNETTIILSIIAGDMISLVIVW